MSVLNTSALKKNSAKDLLNKLQKTIDESNSKKGKEKDGRFWSPEIDSAGNGSAIIRFLPAKFEDAPPFVKTYRHAFEENGMWFIADCPSTIGKPCPCCETNGALWKQGDAGQEIARKRSRKLKYIANVLIIKDPANPENEGQVRLFNFGKKIMDKIEECFKVDPDLGEDPKDPFAFFDGLNFALRIATVGGFINYDKSKFVPAADLYDGDEDKLGEVLEKLHDLKEFNREDLYKSYDEIKARFIKVTTGEDVAKPEPEKKPAQEQYQKPKEESTPASSEDSISSASTEDEDLAFFKSLVEG